MTFLAKGIKCDRIALATEMGEEIKSDMKVYGLKSLVTGSEVCEEKFVKALLETIISTRKDQQIEKCSPFNVLMGIIVGKDGNMIHQEVLCAVTPSLVDNMLLPLEIRDKLHDVQENYFVDISEDNTEPKKIKYRETINETSDDNPVLDSEEIKSFSVENSEKDAKELSRSDEFIKDQMDCPDLEYARK
ncbi:hypothetical protein HNY73_000993 [Argiope bruennichi]|uniref:Uncharacterized protein n=1 Tax=Argiope bruennichi TaxID=94029 RepID=A0A8T0G0Y8_ARGBR|nr:hypothetical protein HNY73_000993 [Argiope bruennichi]